MPTRLKSQITTSGKGRGELVARRLPRHRPPTHPGQMLRDEFLAPLAITQSDLALRLGVSFPRLNEIVRGRRGVTPDTALRLARVVGMSYSLAMRRIVLPQAVRRMIPPFVNSFAGLLKFTSLASVIAVTELLHASTDVIQVTFRPLEVYTFAAVLYLAMILPVTWFSRYLERVKKYA